jgi:hypothetical protein
MHRLFPLSTAAGLSLAAAGCATVKADIGTLDLDGDGIDDGLQDGDGDGDGGDAPDTPGEDPDEPGDDPDEPGDDPDATLTGDWALVSFDGYDDGYTYEGDNCTYTQSFTLFMSVGSGEDGEYRGDMVMDYTWSAEGEDCDYDGEVYSGRYSMNVRADALGDREYRLRVRDWDINTNCELDSSGEALDCDIGMEWEREG